VPGRRAERARGNVLPGTSALIDDGCGKRFAESDEVEVFTTDGVVVGLAAVKGLTPIHARWALGVALHRTAGTV
jgi:hypothetical protein